MPPRNIQDSKVVKKKSKSEPKVVEKDVSVKTISANSGKGGSKKVTIDVTGKSGKGFYEK